MASSMFHCCQHRCCYSGIWICGSSGRPHTADSASASNDTCKRFSALRTSGTCCLFHGPRATVDCDRSVVNVATLFENNVAAFWRSSADCLTRMVTMVAPYFSHRSRIRYLSKKNSRILTNFLKLKKFVKIRTKIR